MTYKRTDKRKNDELRSPILAKVGVVPNADGSAMFQIGKTIAIASVYGPRKMHPQHKQDNTTGQLRCEYNMLSFSVEDRMRPGRNRRSMEISEITKWALEPVLMLKQYPSQVVDVFINIIQADAGTRCAGINAASMALAHAGIPMTGLVSSVSVGKIDKTIVLDLDKFEDSEFKEGEGSTDIPISMTSDSKITHFQLDGKINVKQLSEAMEMAKKANQEMHKVQEAALKAGFKGVGKNE